MQHAPSKHRKKLISGTWHHIPETWKNHTAAKQVRPITCTPIGAAQEQRGGL